MLSIIPHIKITAIAIDYTLIKTSTRTDRSLCIMISFYHMDTGMSRGPTQNRTEFCCLQNSGSTIELLDQVELLGDDPRLTD